MTETIRRSDVMSGIEPNVTAVPDGYSTYTGAPYEYNPVQLPDPPVVTPVITRLSPVSVALDEAPITLYAIGYEFAADSILVFNGGDEITTYHPEGMVSTGVDPSTASGTHTVPVVVRNIDGSLSNEVMFSFTAATAAIKEPDGSPDPDPSEPEPTEPDPARQSATDEQPAD